MVERMRERGLGVTIACTALVLAYLFPVYWMVATSLKPQKDVFAVPPKIVPWPPTFAAMGIVVSLGACLITATTLFDEWPRIMSK